MSRANLQARLAERQHGRATRHLSPFFVLGDPTLELSVELARAAVAAGASMLELGIPYRDPCADGPAVQRACNRAFAAGSSTDRAIAAVAQIARHCPGVPLNLLVYANLAHARGFRAFAGQLADAGASSLLVPDMPLGEDAALRAACDAVDLGLVRLVGPRTSPRRLTASGDGCVLLYVAGVQGVTGATSSRRSERADLLRRAAANTGLPLCSGFGISTAADVAHAFDDGASIAVVGSKFADLIGAALPRGAAAVIDAVTAAVRELSATTTPRSSSTSGT